MDQSEYGTLLTTRIPCGLVSTNPLHSSHIPLVHTAPTTPPYFLVFKCSKLFLACASVLAIPPVCIVFMRLAGSILLPSYLLNCHLLRISDHPFQSSASQVTPLLFKHHHVWFLTALTHCESTFI